MAKSLREELKARNPELFSALERSTDIALKQWLPSVSKSKDSYNSYPHILGIEYHINDILCQDITPEHIIKLNATEIYVLLCSILFHDIGKAIDGTIDHAAESQEIVKNNWSALGIVTDRLSMVIGDICRSHDCDNSDFLDQLSDEYNIDRYEPIRGRKLRALLMLGDKLDNTFKRVVPPYIVSAGKNEMHAVGEFRSKTQAVLVDYSSKMVRTILDREILEDKDLSGPEKLEGALYNYLKDRIGGYTGKKLKSCTLLTIARDVHSNNESLKEIRNELYAMHIPLNAWMIECDNHLYRVEKNGDTYTTHEALEPIISYEYCRDVLRGILFLSGTSFGQSFHTYDNLLRYVKEDLNNLYKIKCAVKRLSVLLKGDDRMYSYALNYINIYYDNVGWQITDLNVEDVYKFNTWANTKTAEEIFTKLDSILERKVGKHDVKK
jgi:hypothetical protein